MTKSSANESSSVDSGKDGAVEADAASHYKVATEDNGKVRLLTLERPGKLNAFTAEGYGALHRALEEAAADPGVSVCVITGRGRAFSAGVDLSEMSRPGGSAELGAHFDPLLDCLAGFPKPLVAAVNGLAVGFGATLLLHCDLVVVDEDAEIRMPFIKLGTCAEAGSSWLLPRRVGMQQAMWMVLSGASLTADAAVRTGFALSSARAGHALEEALTVASRLAEHQVSALIANKRLLRDGEAAQIVEVWQREKAAMAEMAAQLGPIGWDR
jgi:enoyl-CoA hydratase/carnithine racemase